MHPRRTLSLALALALIGACTRDRHYTTRGVVRAVEGTGADRSLTVHHEPIQTFEDRDGKAAPMPSMAMVFGLAPGLEEPPPGSKVALEFDVRWEKRPTLLITRLARLPDSTDLTLDDLH